MSSTASDRQRLDWSGFLGLARSIAMYRMVPGRSKRLDRYYRPLVNQGDLCFDIGAHVGNRSRAMARLGATVVALEPQPAFAAYLRRAFASNDAITLVEEAVGATVGETVLHISRRTPTVSTTDEDWKGTVSQAQGFSQVSWDRRVTVAQTTLDALIARFGVPKLCKIDVEGGEAAVLSGLSQPIPFISFEYTPAVPSGTFACIDRLASLGRYRYRAMVGESIRLVEDRDWSPDEAREWIGQLPSSARSGDLHARLIADDE